MQYCIRSPATATIDPAQLAQALEPEDATALVDRVPAGSALRVATWLPLPALHAVLARAGIAVGEEQIEQLPSECCGGCGG